MKQQIYLSILLALIKIINISCNKEKAVDVYHNPKGTDNSSAVSRKIQFSLYSNKDFSNINQRIQFSAFIRNGNNKTLWDTILPRMSVKDIPNITNKIFIEKRVPDTDSSLLRTGFVYSIENVGISWHLDTCNKNTAIKKVDFNFQ